MIWINMALSIPSSPSKPRVPELDKKPGIHYATTDDGIELPVIDVTHPAFAFDPGDRELAERTESFVRDAKRRERVPAFLANLFYKVALRGSVLAKSLNDAGRGFLPGLSTYLFKLGPDLLGAGYAHPIDRRIAAALPALSMQLRLVDMATLLAEGLTPALESRRSPLHLVNVGGGPSSDSWNALLVLKRTRPELLEGRAVRIHTLDLDLAGPAFGARALDALKAPGAPLQGLDATLTRVPYDWTDAAALPAILRAFEGDAPVVAISSEGALFEYASDAVVTANLAAFHGLTPSDAVVVGSATRDDEVASLVRRGRRIRLQPRSVEAFAALVGSAGWSVAKMVLRPTCRDVLLVKPSC